MSESSQRPIASLDEILTLIAELREKLEDDGNLTPEQRAAIKALIAFYLSLTKKLTVQVDSLMHGEGGKP